MTTKTENETAKMSFADLKAAYDYCTQYDEENLKGLYHKLKPVLINEMQYRLDMIKPTP